MKTFQPFAMLLGCVVAWASLTAQSLPPQLFSEMDGVHSLGDGTTVPFWGYGWVADGAIVLPAPLLEYQEGEQVGLAFTNPSPESHTIHLHGLDVDQANDGVPSTSFAVATGESTQYNFTATHSGTYLYHCHVTTTLHLTMGMYGMVLVTRPDGTLFEGGPTVVGDVPLLFSDMERATAEDPVGSFPFHDMRPDLFFVNGKFGSQLEAEDQTIYAPTNAPLALRLGTMAYSKVVCHFPEALHAEVWMSDGRAVPPEALDSLEMYPGERFTVLIQPDPGFDGYVDVAYWHMVDGHLEATEHVRVRDDALHPSGIESDLAFHEPGLMSPNPAGSRLCVPEPWLANGTTTLRAWDSRGMLWATQRLDRPCIDVSGWPVGTYVVQVGQRRPTRIAVVH